MVATAGQAAASDGVLGVTPRLVAEPASVDEAARVLRSCAVDRLAVVFAGGGTELELGAPPRRLDVVVRTRRLCRIVEHLPADQIATVEAGLPLADLQQHLATHGQRLALDPPSLPGATVGGVVSANAFGPRRLRYGAARDLVVGMTLVRADGVVAKGGGKVVKNVAGFDVPRLLVGACGTLGLVATVTFRLHPLPEAEATVLLGGLTAAQVRQVVRSCGEAHLEPTSMTAVADTLVTFRLGVRFEGFANGVREGTDRLLVAASAGGLSAETADGGGGRSFWELHDRLRTTGAFRARLSAPPAALAQLHASAVVPLAASLTGAAVVTYPALGFVFVGGEPGPADGVAAAVSSARRALAAHAGSLVITAAPPALRALIDVWGPVAAPTLALMRRVKGELDPDGRLAPGRLVGGL